jgi:hypothetical protein
MMVIEERILISADLEEVWTVFTDLTCWNNWNSVIKDASCDDQCLAHGTVITCCFRPFSFPINAQIEVEKVIPNQCVTWSVRKKGFFAHHEFLFQRQEKGILVISRETFTGLLVRLFGFLLPEKKLRALTTTFLKDLKMASESSM